MIASVYDYPHIYLILLVPIAMGRNVLFPHILIDSRSLGAEPGGTVQRLMGLHTCRVGYTRRNLRLNLRLAVHGGDDILHQLYFSTRSGARCT